MFQLECDALVARSTEQRAVMRRTEDLREHLLMRTDPFDGRESSYRPIHALVRYTFYLDENEETGEETLKEVEEVRDRGDGVTHGRKDGTVEYHLPLHSSVWAEE